jgi:hypothetical protein
MPNPPSIEPGGRIAIAGRTGTGKTVIACWLLKRSRQHWVIFNPKHTRGYSSLPGAIVLSVFDPKTIARTVTDNKYVIVNFSGEQASPDYMDACVAYLQSILDNIGICIDELYTMQRGKESGKGLIGWLTRGREAQQSFIGLMQRPAFITLFAFSESGIIISMDLVHKDDRKKLMEWTGNPLFLNRLTRYHWRAYNVNADTTTLWGPVPADVPALTE